MSRKKTIALVSIIILLLLFLVISTVFHIRTVKVTGAEVYTENEIETMILGHDTTQNTLLLWLKTKFGEKISLPFVETYDVKIKGIDSVEIQIYEKKVIGYIESMGNRLYFDKDGIVVETTDGTEDARVPLITGLKFDYAVLHEPIPVKKKNTFQLILDLVQLIQKYEIEITKVYINEDLSVNFYMNDVKILFGSSDFEKKMNHLKGFQEELKELSGVFDMRIVSDSKLGYVFTKNPEKAELPIATETDAEKEP